MTRPFIFLSAAAVLIITAQFFLLQNQSNQIDELKQNISRLSAEKKLLADESRIRMEAFQKREENLKKARKEISDEFKKLQAERRNNTVYNEWARQPLPDFVTELMHNGGKPG